jgi:ribonuclease BN (tRNA processing enzyme)
LVVLGTGGGSNPKATRAGYANAVVVGGDAYLIDCGEGVGRQAWKAGISTNVNRVPEGGAALRSISVTHLHSDHIIDLANLLLGFWPEQQIDIYGPAPAGLPIPTFPPDREVELLFPDEPTPGIAGYVDRLLSAFAFNINVRIADEGRPNFLDLLRVHEIGVTRDGYTPHVDLGVSGSGRSAEVSAPDMDPVVIRPEDDNGVTISATLVQHAPVFPALGYRIDTPVGSAAFSGDTGMCGNVARLAAGADVLVHEVIDLERIERRISRLANAEGLMQHLREAHTTPEDAGRIAAEAGVETLVLSHLVPGDDEIPEEAWEEKAATHFGGRVVCGVDLDEFSLDRITG